MIAQSFNRHHPTKRTGSKQRSTRMKLVSLAVPMALGWAMSCKSPVSSIPAQKPASAKHVAPAKEDSNQVPIRADRTVFGESQLMGTRVSINVYVGPAKSGTPAGKAITQAFAEIARIESIASEWIKESELSKLSASAGQGWRPVSPDMWELLKRSETISQATKGLFDITFHSVGQLWNFKPGSAVPKDQAIQAALSNVNHRLIELDPKGKQARLTKASVALGMGAIAKGYGVDMAAALLKSKGFANFIVEAGGDTYVSGSKGEKSWKVGIQNPAGPGAMGALQVQNKAVVTSGNYERYFVHDGVYYTHILDPRTGYPIPRDKSPRSVTVVADNATDADAYCTALAVMGTKQALEFVKQRSDLETIIVDAKGTLHVSPGLSDIYQSWSPAKP